MRGFVDLERRFHELSDQELEDSDDLSARSEHLPGSTTGWPELLEHHRVVLLAEAGAGKTAEMQQQAKRLAAEGKFAFFAALEDLDRGRINEALATPEDETRFQEWMADKDAPAWFFLDSVDELKLTQGKLDRALRALSKTLADRLDRARIFISCRPSDWRPLVDADTVRDRLPIRGKRAEVPSEPSEEIFVEALRREFGLTLPAPHDQPPEAPEGALRTFMMIPMNDTQIGRFARQHGMQDVAVFLDAVRRHDAWTFARRPLDLAGLLETWIQSGSLGTRAQQHETNISAKLRDDPDRPGSDILSEAKARDGAERLALALALTRTRTVRSPEQALDAARAEGVLDPDSILPDWTGAERKALLRRALFDPATYGRVRFHHRSTQEYLAAQCLFSLRRRGMTIRALRRLLFATCYGVDVVFPSMRAIAAWLALWDDSVRNALMNREPEALLSLGDPESLDVATRERVVRQFVAAYRDGGWRGLNVPIAEVRRLAHPDLAPLIRDSWSAAANDEVRELLIEMVWQGPVEQCADLARAAAFDAAASPRRRVVAVRALIACDRGDDVADVATDVLERRADWPDRVVHGVAADLFPRFITAEQLLTLMERTEEPRHTVGGFEWASLQIAERIDSLSAHAIRLRNGLADLVRSGRAAGSGLYELHSRFGHLVPALATLCERQLMKRHDPPDAALVNASVVANRFGDGRYRVTGVGREPCAAIRKRVGVEATARRDVFWAERAFVNEIAPTDDGRRQLHDIMHDGIVEDLQERDRPWLLEDFANARRPERRPVALQALIDLWHGSGRRPADREEIRARLNGDHELGRDLEHRTRPPEPDEGVERMEREHERRKRADAARERRHLEKWRSWRRDVIADPARAFSEGNRDRTVSNLYTFLDARKESRNQYDVWDKSALIAAFGPAVADRAEEALRSGWPSTRPELWSARVAGVRNHVPGQWILALMGVSAEATTPGWSTRLSSDDVETAIAYAMIELNGFAPFLSDLVESHPEEVARVVGNEVVEELGIAEGHEHLPVLQDLTYADPGLQRLCAPYLADCLRKWPSVVDAGVAERRARFLDQTLRIAGTADEQATRGMLAKECAARYREDPSAALAVSWLKGLFRFDPEQAVRQLVEEDEAGASADPEIGRRMVKAFGVVFGEDDPVDLRVAEQARQALLASLVRLAYTHVGAEDDQVHEDVYSPDTRDNAERARRMLFQWLCDTPGPDTRRALLELAKDEQFADMRDRLALLARERAAIDAEFPPFDSEAVVALGECCEAPPDDGSGLFAVMMDRLEDLQHELAHGDFSDRRTVRNIDEEEELRRTLGWRLNERANGAYRTVQEDEVADAKRPDVRLVTVGARDARVAIELKIADKWTFRELEEALRRQLVGQSTTRDSTPFDLRTLARSARDVAQRLSRGLGGLGGGVARPGRGGVPEPSQTVAAILRHPDTRGRIPGWPDSVGR